MPNDEVLELPTKRVNKKPKNEAVGPRVDGNGKPCPYITHEELLMLGNARKTAEAPHMTPDNAKLPAILLCPPADFASAEEQDAITESSPSVQNAPETAKLPVMQDAITESLPPVQNAPETAKLPVMQDAITESLPPVQNAPETAKLPVMQDTITEPLPPVQNAPEAAKLPAVQDTITESLPPVQSAAEAAKLPVVQDTITESLPPVQNAPETAKLPVMQDAAAEAPLAHQGPSIPESSVEQGGLPETEATESIQVRPSEQDTAKRSPSVEGGQPAPSAGEE